jgi:membrane fusion protein, heavy metal efflux system
MKLQSTALIAAAALLFSSCGETNSGTAEARGTEPAPPPVRRGEIVLPADSPKMKQIRVEPIATAEVPADEVGSPGKVEVNANRVARVSLPVSGRISTVTVHVGDAVTQGQVLLTVESPDVDLAISNYLQAKATLTQNSAALAKAQADLDRTRDLYENGAVAKKELLNVDSILTQSKAGVQQAEAGVQQASRRLEIFGVKPGEFGQRLAVRAPVSGKVLELKVVPGEFRNDTNAEVIVIADLSSVWVTSDVPESSIRFVHAGEPVQIELAAYPGEMFRGTVRQIADTVDPQTRTIKVRAVLPNPDGRLRPDMFARIRLVSNMDRKPVVPNSAILQSESGTAVVREMTPGHFQQVPVKLGARVGDKVAVLSGLDPGDRVVTDGVLLVRN